MDLRFNGQDFIQLSNSLHQQLHQQQLGHQPPPQYHQQMHHLQLQLQQLQPTPSVNNNLIINNDHPIEAGLPLQGFPCVTESDEICFIKLFLEHFNTSMPFLTREILHRGKESNLKYFAVDDGVNVENSDIASSFSITWSVCAFGASMKCDTRTLLYLDYARFFLQYCFDTPCILSTVAMLAYEYASFIVSLRDPNINNSLDLQRNHVHRMKKKLYLGFGSVILESNDLTEAILDLNASYLHSILCLKYEVYDMNAEKLKAAIESCEESYKKFNLPMNLKISLYSYICYSKWCLSTYWKNQNSPEHAFDNIDHVDQLKSDKFHLDSLIVNEDDTTVGDVWLDTYGFSLAKDYSSPLMLQASIARHYVHMDNINEAKPFARNIARSIIERNILICTPIIWDVCYFTASILYHSVVTEANSEIENADNECLNDEFYCSQLGFNLFQTCYLCEPLRESGWRQSYKDYKRNAYAYELARSTEQSTASSSGEIVKRQKENHKSENWAIILDLRLSAYL